MFTGVWCSDAPRPAPCDGVALWQRIEATCTESEICLFSPLGEPVLSFQPAVEKFKEQWWRGFATQSGRELWLVSAERKQVWRFELP
ncbi:MAG TPA: hypothetical protein VNT26_16425 [Candidatus Sulfotelmatobacter sp.]|nr:hypothetical protein [Candidatus Sulfotelmatobacter sp.]HWI56242.1 hypothetical protein [Bacillota bacterium]